MTKTKTNTPTQDAGRLLTMLKFCLSVIKANGIFELSERLAHQHGTEAVESITNPNILHEAERARDELLGASHAEAKVTAARAVKQAEARATAKRPRRLSPAGRRRIAAAQRRRWAEYNKQKATKEVKA